VDADLDTLATALYVRADDLLKSFPEHLPWRPTVGITPKISDVEMVTLGVMQASLGTPVWPGGSGSPTSTCATCSPTCPSSRATTSDFAASPPR
jgi:hypothetical protein